MKKEPATTKRHPPIGPKGTRGSTVARSSQRRSADCQGGPWPRSTERLVHLRVHCSWSVHVKPALTWISLSMP
eukprot:3043142-Amphidinium_carterae.1